MPAPRDLTGMRFGHLMVLRSDGVVKYGRDMTAWLCLCDCGAEVRVPQKRLTTKSTSHQQHACDLCRSKPCVICGKLVPLIAHSLTCSPECKDERNRRYYLAYYHDRCANDPDFIARQRAYKRRRWAAMTPEQRLEDSRTRAKYVDRAMANELARKRHMERMESDQDYAARKRKSREDRLQRIGIEAARDEARAAAVRLRARRTEIEMLNALQRLNWDDDDGK